MAETQRRRVWPIVLGGLAALILVLVLIWDWNWFTPIVERIASERLHRPVKIGHLSLHLARQPRLVLDDLSIGDPPDDPAHGKLVVIEKLAVRVDAMGLLHRNIILPEISLTHPVIEMHRYGNGETNYSFTSGGTTSSSEPPQIGSLIVDDGHVHFDDPTLKSNFNLTINTPVEAGERKIRVDAKGTYAAQPITGRFIGGSVLTLRDAQHPYPIDLDLRNGATHVTMVGTVKDPMSFAGASVKLVFEGDDLSQLYPLTGVPIPPTPKYHLTGMVDVAGEFIRFNNFAGTVGDSDLEGDIAVAPGKERRFITADLRSNRVVLADLAGFIGNAPGKADSAEITPAQRAAKAKQDADAPLLPTTPINLPKLRAADLKVHYVGKRIESTSTPLDNLDVKLSVQDGTIRLDPLKFGVGDGSIAINLALNGQGDQVHAKGDARVQHVDLKRIMQDLKPFKGQGVIGGKLDIETIGNSPAAMLANGNGNAAVTMAGGNLSALLADLGGLEVGRAIYRYIGASEQSPVHCMVADVGLKQGLVSTKSFVLDTGEENLFLSGTMNLRDQTMNLRLSSEAKHFSILSVKAPVDITGSLKSPSVSPELTSLAKRGGPAAVLGVLLTPAAALLATIELGSGEDTDCKGLVATVKQHDANVVNAPEQPAMPAATDAKGSSAKSAGKPPPRVPGR